MIGGRPAHGDAPGRRVQKVYSVPRNSNPHRSGLLGRVIAPTLAALMLASCQTTAKDNTAQGDADPTEATETAAKAPSAKPGAATAYVDPMVSTAEGPATQPAVAPAVAAAYAPTQGPADLGELTMQPTGVNASRNSLFSATAAASEAPVAETAAAPQPADPQVATAAAPAASASPSIVVPSDLPTRKVNPMSKSLFSAELREPEPPVVETAARPATSAEEMPVYSSDEQPVYDPAEPYVEEDQAKTLAPQAAPEVVAETPPAEEPKKRKWLPSLGEIFGKKKS